MKSKHNIAIFWAILSAVLYAISLPVSQILLKKIPPTIMGALLYLGAGFGISIIYLYCYKTEDVKSEMRLTKKELPATIWMVVVNIASVIFMMVGLTMTTSANASLLNNFEIVATSLLAFFFFNEKINKRLWIAITLITVSSIILSVEDISGFAFSIGSIFILFACACWGIENNCTRVLSVKDPLQVVTIKGLGSGFGALIISFIIKENTNNIAYIIATLILGFVSYGLSIFFYVRAQRELGAAKTSAYYAIAPFIAAGLSFIIFLQVPTTSFVIALLIMIVGTYFASTDSK
ncbi:drug/metabolite transporter (DMT)-like permease [Clostridium saccharoperbutylacetonicum]|uniref:Permeases of the drug/metabolite transporter (DMT) superfamily n=1 Tax=Clostridium saccharoperbutylacetonicum N1-4(HMT) TaxID=931276 RepID=M1MLR0_9CLOT|nr:DMT family transporter [Clostridium saccharoperbutylacetonicum]AGF55711.1 permeases of the drug/metabolite transporter (DMT) superfamily [Clostridium saccharoperbutylacetonicum N1-4(HMT)]NRT63560.1 drug/metabolite transporter (DMT)-like permease [Clostridium saccharoperbutylacetonicum]NSB26923.1 drug/metabolite transporter (DMT)-like permease [Clostridium saccharoperbutylacetonicum]NSB40407.1 drug/metabolite transporter (DMT)-like permease [Clostridium saccharoperbutylacetonicum]